jgi:hypothetical protein
MVKKKTAGPRLKICSQCEEPNPPRQFYCKSCNHPFYTEEYFANRAPLQSSTLVSPRAHEEPLSEYMEPPPGWDLYMVDGDECAEKMFSNLNRPKLVKMDSLNPSVREVRVFPQDSLFEIAGGTSCRVNETHELLFTGEQGCVDSVSVEGNWLATLVGNKKLLFWDLSLNEAELVCEIVYGDSFVYKATWIEQSQCRGVSTGLLLVVLLDRIEVLYIPAFTERESKRVFSISVEEALVFSTTVIPEPYFPCQAKGRVHADSCTVEILSVNNQTGFCHYFRLERGFQSDFPYQVRQIKVFGANIPVRRLTEDESTMSGTGTCVCFIDRFKFAVGYSTGEIGVFDVRDDHGPANIITYTAGYRRWLVDMVATGPETLLASYQAGSVLANIFSDNVGAVPIGGDVRSAQCFGIGALGNQVFSAMSSGVVLAVDWTLKDKVRRALTRYVSQWTVNVSENRVDPIASSSSLDDKVLDRLQTCSSPSGEYRLKIFPNEKLVTVNVRLLKPSDGASNEPPIEDQNRRGVRISCLSVIEKSGLVVYGLEGGLIHVVHLAPSPSAY